MGEVGKLSHKSPVDCGNLVAVSTQVVLHLLEQASLPKGTVRLSMLGLLSMDLPDYPHV